jgi:hypothetical protein
MQVVDANGNVFGQGLEITGIDGKPKVPVINTDITIGTTVINGGVSGRLLFDDAGVVGETAGLNWNKITSVFTVGITGANGTIQFPTTTSGFVPSIISQFAGNNLIFTVGSRSLSMSGSGQLSTSFNTTITGSTGGTALTVAQGNSAWTPVADFNGSSGTALRINTNGNILVGTTTDAGFRFDVAGTIRSQGSLFISNPSFTLGGSITHSANATLVIAGGPGGGENITIGPSNRIFINAQQTRFSIGSVQIASTLSVGVANTTTATMLWVTGGITASSSIARGISLNTALTQSAANDVLTAVNIAPTFTVNNTLFHDVYWMRFTGSYVPASFTGNNNAATIDLSNSFTNANNAIGIRIRHTYSNVQNGYGILIESPSFIGIAQTSLTSTNFLAGTTVIGSSVVAPAAGYTLHVTNNTNGAIKVGSASQGSEHLIISHSQAGSTFSSIRNTFAATGATMLIDVAGQNNLRLFGTGNVAINNSTDAGFRLDVNGTARVSGNITQAGANTAALGYITNGTLGVYSNAPGTGTVGILVGCVSNGGHTAIFTKGNNSGSTALRVTDQNVGASVNHLMVDFVGATGFGIANGTTVVNSSAQVEIQSTTKGFLPPRMTNAQMLAIATPSAGLIVYDTTNNKHYGYDGTTWNPFY